MRLVFRKTFSDYSEYYKNARFSKEDIFKIRHHGNSFVYHLCISSFSIYLAKLYWAKADTVLYYVSCGRLSNRMNDLAPLKIVIGASHPVPVYE